jgi:hypothetical protein
VTISFSRRALLYKVGIRRTGNSSRTHIPNCVSLVPHTDSGFMVMNGKEDFSLWNSGIRHKVAQGRVSPAGGFMITVITLLSEVNGQCRYSSWKCCSECYTHTHRRINQEISEQMEAEGCCLFVSGHSATALRCHLSPWPRRVPLTSSWPRPHCTVLGQQPASYCDISTQLQAAGSNWWIENRKTDRRGIERKENCSKKKQGIEGNKNR